jgi:hypothetical protein
MCGVWGIKIENMRRVTRSFEKKGYSAPETVAQQKKVGSFSLAQLVKQIAPRLNQDGLVRFQIFLNGFYALAEIGDANGVGLV